MSNSKTEMKVTCNSPVPVPVTYDITGLSDVQYSMLKAALQSAARVLRRAGLSTQALDYEKLKAALISAEFTK